MWPIHLNIAVCFEIFDVQFGTSSWLAAAPSLTVVVGVLCCCFFVGSCLDEDCNLGRGDSGRPLRCGLCWRWWWGIRCCSLATGLQAGQRVEQKKIKRGLWLFGFQLKFQVVKSRQLGIIWEYGRLMLSCSAIAQWWSKMETWETVSHCEHPSIWGHPWLITGRRRVSMHWCGWLSYISLELNWTCLELSCRSSDLSCCKQ